MTRHLSGTPFLRSCLVSQQLDDCSNEVHRRCTQINLGLPDFACQKTVEGLSQLFDEDSYGSRCPDSYPAVDDHDAVAMPHLELAAKKKQAHW